MRSILSFAISHKIKRFFLITQIEPNSKHVWFLRPKSTLVGHLRWFKSGIQTKTTMRLLEYEFHWVFFWFLWSWYHPKRKKKVKKRLKLKMDISWFGSVWYECCTYKICTLMSCKGMILKFYVSCMFQNWYRYEVLNRPLKSNTWLIYPMRFWISPTLSMWSYIIFSQKNDEYPCGSFLDLLCGYLYPGLIGAMCDYRAILGV